MADASVEHVVVEGGLELSAVVGLDALHAKGQLLEDIVQESARRRAAG